MKNRNLFYNASKKFGSAGKWICIGMLLVSLLLTSCGKNDLGDKLVPTPLTWEMIDAIPVATDDMTEEELRQICVDYFRLQISFQWSPKEDLDYLITGYKKQTSFPAGVKYAGLPYMCTSSGYITGNLYIAMDYYDPATGLMDNSGMADQVFAERIGNNCSGGSFWGWARVVNSVTDHTCRSATETFGFIPLGSYDYHGVMKWTNAYTTIDACEENGKQVMYEAYALAQPADGLVVHRGGGGDAHMRMVSQTAVVERLPDGTIDGNKSYLVYLDQTSGKSDTTIDGYDFKIQGGLDRKITFSDLYTKGYVPFTFAELIGEDPVEPAEVALDLKNPESATVTDLYRSKLSANYAISHTTLTVQDKKGNEVYSNTYYSPEHNLRQTPMLTLINRDELAPCVNGDYTVTIACRVGTGQNLIAYSGALVE